MGSSMSKSDAETITYVRNLLDDNLRLLRVIRLRADRSEELSAIIEETYAGIEGLAHRWRRNPPEPR